MAVDFRGVSFKEGDIVGVISSDTKYLQQGIVVDLTPSGAKVEIEYNNYKAVVERRFNQIVFVRRLRHWE